MWWVRQKRDKAVHQIPKWELLRETASQIKNNVLSKLDNYLIQFEAQANGITVHWAADAEEHNQIVHSLLTKHDINRMVKSKSMLTEECHLNGFLSKHGVEVIDSVLGERIVQLADEPPSHIVLPCIHKEKEEIGELFHKHLGTPKGNSDLQFLTETNASFILQKFSSMAATIGSKLFMVNNPEEVKAMVREQFYEGRIVTTITELAAIAETDLKTVPGPYLLENIELLIMRTHFSVAENSAVWVTEI